ncbi:MAG: aldo/keto reductase [Bacillota bacterium]|nr:aldo/keto reductase [Bacillota bacterium]
MEMRTFENIDIQTSLLGYGCMRFPTKEGKIDYPEAEKLIDTAIRGGVNYIDTAYPYHNGESEPVVGKILKKYDRSSFFIATKLPCWSIESVEDAKKLFEEQLNRLDMDYVDFYLLHSMNLSLFQKMADLGVLDYLDQEKKAGRIRFFGFSFHDSFSSFEKIINYRKWDFCQIQLNYMDTEIQAGLKGLKLAEELHVPVIIMEPVKGGRLANLPEEAVLEFHKLLPDQSVSSWAMRYVGSLPGVKVILSGMSNGEQVKDNLCTFNNFKKLNNEELKAVEKVAEILKNKTKNGCTSCGYCKPCPFGVDIPHNFSIWSELGIYQNKEITKTEWKHWIADKEKAKNCMDCGKCESLCPQKISIRADLKKLQKELDEICI